MVEERTTETREADGSTHTHTTVVHDDTRRGGGTPGWVWLILLAIIAIGAFVVISQLTGAEVAKDAAIGDAANEVGEAAGQVGDAASDVADEVTGN